ncbi:exported protein of unknown function [Denitratisoma oestradiolicum]|uniref:Uncharacterized protein n=1 Tax=Denitratisoma oestradiolicum TaxID=311182 RepID=A0A6S6XT97_9PROT|nr:exported protein of unknown function [Denitratisoma oestradiolicum]
MLFTLKLPVLPSAPGSRATVSRCTHPANTHAVKTSNDHFMSFLHTNQIGPGISLDLGLGCGDPHRIGGLSCDVTGLNRHSAALDESIEGTHVGYGIIGKALQRHFRIRPQGQHGIIQKHQPSRSIASRRDDVILFEAHADQTRVTLPRTLNVDYSTGNLDLSHPSYIGFSQCKVRHNQQSDNQREIAHQFHINASQVEVHAWIIAQMKTPQRLTSGGSLDDERLLAADLTSLVGSGIVLANRHSRSVLLAGFDLGVALNLGTTLDGAGRVLGNVAFTNRNGSCIFLLGLDFGVSLNLDTLSIGRRHRTTGTSLGSLTKSSGSKSGNECENENTVHSYWLLSWNRNGLLATDHAGFIGSGIVLAHSHSCGILLAGRDFGVALNLGAALDGASRVLGNVAFTHGNSSGVFLLGLDLGVALNLDALRVAGTLGLLSKSGGSNNGRCNENSDNAHSQSP